MKKADEQPVAQSADSSASNTQSTSAESADANDVLNQKLNVYIDCYNNLQADIYRAVNRYANTFDDFRTGPTGKEDDPLRWFLCILHLSRTAGKTSRRRLN